MRVGIIGSRKINKIDLNIIINEIPQECTEIVSGGAKGIDSIAQEVAIKLNLPIKLFLPNYALYKKAAPIKRNQEIVDYSDFVLAVWDFSSAGTKNTILKSLKNNKKIKIIIAQTDEV